MTKPPTRERIRVFRESLTKLDPRESPPWDLSRIYGELLEVVASEHPEDPLAKDAERPVRTSDRRGTVQVSAMTTVLDQLILLYPQRMAAPMVTRPRRSILDEEW